MKNENLIHDLTDIAADDYSIRVKTVQDGVQTWIAKHVEIALIDWTPEEFKQSYSEYFGEDAAAVRADLDGYPDDDDFKMALAEVDAGRPVVEMTADVADGSWYYKPEELATNKQRVDALIEGCWWAYEVKVDRESLKEEFR